MLKLLLKKQLTEIFRAYFYNPKNNKARSAGAIIALFLLFGLVIVMIGGMFTFLSLTLCAAFTAVGAPWMFFLLMSLIAVLLGTFGSVFNTYSKLYIARDNELLFSMPIPVRDIILSRLISVYLMGALYSGAVILPAVIVSWFFLPLSAGVILGGILLAFLVTLFVFLLSCLLGFAVAKVSVHIRKKTLVTVLLSLVFIGLYYFVYFRAQALISELTLRADYYADQVKPVYPLYLFGSVGVGDWFAMGVCTLFFAAVSAGVWFLLKRSFFEIASLTQSVKTKKAKHAENEKPQRKNSVGAALLKCEFRHLGSSSVYLLNSALGVIIMPILGVLILIKGGDLVEAVNLQIPQFLPMIQAVFPLIVCSAGMMIDTAAPSVSLEGKRIWILQSLPVRPLSVLCAKGFVQLILSIPGYLFLSVCGVVVFRPEPALAVWMILLPVSFAFLSALSGLSVGVRFANLNWTSEMFPVKQGAPVFIAIFGSMVYGAVFSLLYLFLLIFYLSPAVYLAVLTALNAVGSILLFLWLKGPGSRRFADL